jgi:hypothetical protein
MIDDTKIIILKRSFQNYYVIFLSFVRTLGPPVDCGVKSSNFVVIDLAVTGFMYLFLFS